MTAAAEAERSFWELERSFFNGRKFRDEEDLAAQLLWWQRNVCDVRRHKKDKRTALEAGALSQASARGTLRLALQCARDTWWAE
ncbi:MAG: hypothetical protein ACT4TC_02015 [Myxococcaceae bacterium]